MIDMTFDLITMIIYRGKSHCLEAFSLVVLLAGLFFLVLGLIPGAQI
jgi:MFS superfamily sulfate permease-like transporter